MSVLEGMAAGLPCVITTGCNFPEARAAGAAHVVPPAIEPLTAALLNCFSDPPAAQAMGRRARRFIFDNYTWDQVAQRLTRVYQAVLNNEPLPEFTPAEAV
jgi:glycosyltransferase involved in cell wall biosynthesis